MNDQVLRTLDPATTPADLVVAEDPAAQAVLGRITAGDAGVVVPIKRPRRTRRLVLAAGAVAAAGAIALTAPAFLGGPQQATAAWSPVARALDPHATGKAEAVCRQAWAETMDLERTSDVRAYVAEQRGRWSFVYASDPGGANQYTCRLLDGRFAGGGARNADGPQGPVASDGVLGASAGAASNSHGSYWDISGLVGADVVELVLDTAQQGPVTATITRGHFAAWWPGPAINEGDDFFVPEGIRSATLTLRDGSTRRLTYQQLIGDVPVDR